MTHWLDPCHRALDGLSHPATVFFRDDDAGWDDAKLFALLDLFLARSLPITLAVIPRALSRATARRLGDIVDMFPALVEIHQHGCAHLNHEVDGRRCEFGPSRSLDTQRLDIERGRALLADALGSRARPIFTPPWNRCTAVTARCLVESGFRILSRDAGAKPIDVVGLTELPVTVDWFGRRHARMFGAAQLGATLAAAISADRPAGIMLHHARMDVTERWALEELLHLLTHPNIRLQTMWPVGIAMMPREQDAHHGVL